MKRKQVRVGNTWYHVFNSNKAWKSKFDEQLQMNGWKIAIYPFMKTYIRYQLTKTLKISKGICSPTYSYHFNKTNKMDTLVWHEEVQQSSKLCISGPEFPQGHNLSNILHHHIGSLALGLKHMKSVLGISNDPKIEIKMAIISSSCKRIYQRIKRFKTLYKVRKPCNPN